MTLTKIVLLLFIVISVAIVIFVAMFRLSGDPWPPVRPANVPNSATFVGGLDGWDWVNCSPTSDKHLQCDVYHQLGRLDRTSFLTACFNLRPKYWRDARVPVQLQETSILFDKVSLYEYRPSVPADKSREDVSQKYYRLLGVTEQCEPASPETELVVVDPIQ